MLHYTSLAPQLQQRRQPAKRKIAKLKDYPIKTLFSETWLYTIVLDDFSESRPIEHGFDNCFHAYSTHFRLLEDLANNLSTDFLKMANNKTSDRQHMQ